ncbi:hypothetical protein [Streptomyces sp. NPDC002067]
MNVSLPPISDLLDRHALVAVGVGCLSVSAAVAAVRLWRTMRPGLDMQPASARGAARRRISAGTLIAILAFVVCTSISLNTSYRYTGDVNGLAMTSDVERLLSCAGYETLMALFVLGARERMSGPSKSPGWYGSAVWIFAGLSAIPAANEGGGLTGATAVRIILGSFGSALAAHAALGLDLRHRTGEEADTPTAILLRACRERLMSHLGVSELDRTAREIAQDRALDRAVDLRDRYRHKTPKQQSGLFGRRLAKRLAAAQDAAQLATDPVRRAEYKKRCALREHATTLAISADDSPWTTPVDLHPTRAAQVEQVERLEALADDAEAAVLGALPPELTADVLDELMNPAPDACYDEPAETPEEPARPRIAAAHGSRGAGDSVTVRIPAPTQPTADEQPQPAPVNLDGHSTKKQKLLALARLRVTLDDTRSTNAVTESLLAELEKQGITYDRGAAHRAVTDYRESLTRAATDSAAHDGTAHDSEAHELCAAAS